MRAEAVSGAGDVNGDGVDDLLIGAPQADPDGYESGTAYVVLGGATVGSSGTVELGTLDGTNGYRLNGTLDYDYAGRSVSDAGDVNGDGFDDLIIGAPRADADAEDAGIAYVVFGEDDFSSNLQLNVLNGSDGFRLEGAATDDNTGRAVSGAGDVNGDGFDDLLVGAPDATSNGYYDAGAAYVVFGGATVGSGGTVALGSLDGSDGFVLNGSAEGESVGRAVSGAGDVNGDGFADLIIGAPEAAPNGENTGAAYVVFGGAGVGSSGTIELGSLTGSAGFVVAGVAEDDDAGFAVSGAGDVNGDGFADLLVGARGADPNGNYEAGAAYVVFGGGMVGSSGIDRAEHAERPGWLCPEWRGGG